ncbi:MAG: hypothetical protein M5U22_03725 [Thermoleophilia bacterium]|nr:hypothetical protein [Thermoleophilia bacterium]
MYATVVVHSGPSGATRYAAQVRDGRVVRAWGPLDRTEGLGVRSIVGILSSNRRAERDLQENGRRLTELLARGGAEIVEVPEVVRVRVGIMGGSVDEDVDAHRLAVAWVDRIMEAFGIDDVCVACTVNLGGFPPKDFCTAYWTADGEFHDRTAPEDEAFRAITELCWEAALGEVVGTE